MRIAPTLCTVAAANAAAVAATRMTTTRTAGLIGMMRANSPCRAMISNVATRAVLWGKAAPAPAAVATVDRRRTARNRCQHRHDGCYSIRSGRKLFASADQQNLHRKRRGPSPSSPDAGAAAKLQGEWKPASVVVLASGSMEGGEHNDEERCRRLADELGAALVVEGGQGGGDLQRERGAGNAVADSVRFTMLFDESGRLALGQPGSGFTPLVVS